jgi:hypothetical protein
MKSMMAGSRLWTWTMSQDVPTLAERAEEGLVDGNSRKDCECNQRERRYECRQEETSIP